MQAWPAPLAHHRARTHHRDSALYALWAGPLARLAVEPSRHLLDTHHALLGAYQRVSKTIYLTPTGKRRVDEIRVLMALGWAPKQAAKIVLRREKAFCHGEPEQQRIASVKVFAALAAMDAEVAEA